jgi:hypothetical protein
MAPGTHPAFHDPAIRAQEISEAQLKPILEIRRVAAAAGDGAEPAFGLAHPVHVMGLRELVKGGKVDGTPVAIRVLESRGPQIAAFYDVSTSSIAPQVLQTAGSDSHYASLLERGIDAAARWAGKREQAHLRLLRIPALHTEALLLRTNGEKEETAIVVRTPQAGVEMLTPMPLSELVSLLEPAARLILTDDDGRKPS